MAVVALAAEEMLPRPVEPTELMVTEMLDSEVVVAPTWKLIPEKVPSSSFLPLKLVASAARVISLASCWNSLSRAARLVLSY